LWKCFRQEHFALFICLARIAVNISSVLPGVAISVAILPPLVGVTKSLADGYPQFCGFYFFKV